MELNLISIFCHFVGILSAPRFDMAICQLILGINKFKSLKTFVCGKGIVDIVKLFLVIV